LNGKHIRLKILIFKNLRVIISYKRLIFNVRKALYEKELGVRN